MSKRETLHLIFIGTSYKFEERIAIESAYWEEVAGFFPSFDFVFHLVGPEMSKANHRKGEEGRPKPRPRLPQTVCLTSCN